MGVKAFSSFVLVLLKNENFSTTQNRMAKNARGLEMLGMTAIGMTLDCAMSPHGALVVSGHNRQQQKTRPKNAVELAYDLKFTIIGFAAGMVFELLNK